MNANQPIGQRVAEVMSTMSLAQEDFLVEGHGTANEPPTPGTNPYVFWMPGIQLSCSSSSGSITGSIPSLGRRTDRPGWPTASAE